MRIAGLVRLATLGLVTACVGIGFLPASAAASCDAPRYQRDYVYPHGTAKIADKPRAINRSNQVLRLVWRRELIDWPTIRWFSGCRTGVWDVNVPPKTLTDTMGRSYVRFTSLRAPRGNLELWAEFDEWPEPGSDYEVANFMTYLGSIRMSRTIPKNELSVELSVGKLSDPGIMLRSMVTLTHQQDVTVRHRFVARSCDEDRCHAIPLGQRSLESPGRLLIAAKDEISFPLVFPSGQPDEQLEVSYRPRYLPEAEQPVSGANFDQLCDAVRRGRKVKVEVTVDVRQLDTNDRIKQSHASRRINAGTCRPIG